MLKLISKNMPVEEYLQLDQSGIKKHEFYNGEVVCLGDETEHHNLIVSNIVCEIGSFLGASGFEIFPASAYRVAIPDGNGYFYPDATIVEGGEEFQFGIFDTILNPIVLFEVVSEQTKDRDRGYKMFAYQQIPSLQEYILVDSTGYQVDVIRRDGDNTWDSKTFKVSQKSFVIESVGQTVRLKDLYFKVFAD